MIHYSELRVGNILSVGGNFWHVETIDGDKLPALYFAENREYDHYLNAEGIPLSESVIRTCGGMLLNSKSTWGEEGHFLLPQAEPSELGWHPLYGLYDIVENQRNVFKHIKHLHELQNFFRFWTGKELEIDLKALHVSKQL